MGCIDSLRRGAALCTVDRELGSVFTFALLLLLLTPVTLLLLPLFDLSLSSSFLPLESTRPSKLPLSSQHKRHTYFIYSHSLTPRPPLTCFVFPSPVLHTTIHYISFTTCAHISLKVLRPSPEETAPFSPCWPSLATHQQYRQ